MAGEVLRLSIPPFGPVDIGVTPREGGTVQFMATTTMGGRSHRVSCDVAEAFARAILTAADVARRHAVTLEAGD